MLSNAVTTAGVDDLGLHLLYTQVPLVKPPKQHTEIPVDPKTFDAYTGQYQMAPNVILSVTARRFASVRPITRPAQVRDLRGG